MTNQNPIASPWLTVKQANAYSTRSVTMITRALRDGSLRGSQRTRGGTWLIHRDDLDAWIRGEKADVQVPAVTGRRSA